MMGKSNAWIRQESGDGENALHQNDLRLPAGVFIFGNGGSKMLPLEVQGKEDSSMEALVGSLSWKGRLRLARIQVSK